MGPRCLTVAAGILLLHGVISSAPRQAPVLAQDDDDGGFEWPEIPTFQIPGTFATAGTVEDAGTIATLPGSIRVVTTGDGRATLAPDIGVELILDNSGSMLIPLGGEQRIDIAKEVFTGLVEETLPPRLPVALRVFGDAPDSCDTSLAIPLAPLDRSLAVSQIAAINSVDGVKTPIGDALAHVAADLAGVHGPKIVVLVTDGEETCGGHPQRAIRDLVAQGVDVRVNIVGFAVDDADLKKQFDAWARAGGGQYFDAGGSEELGKAIAAALQPPYEVLDESGAVVGTGVVNGEAVSVPAGSYRVDVLSDPPQTFADVAVGNSAEVVLELETGD